MRGLGDGVGLAVVPVGGGGAWPGFETTRRAAEQRPGPTGVEGAGGTGGHGRGAGGWRQGQGGPRDRPLRAVRLACGDLAGGPPPTGTQSDQTELGRSCAVDGGRAERRSRRGRRAGGPPPTGTPSSPDRRKTPAQPPAFTASQQHAEKSYEKYESFIGSS